MLELRDLVKHYPAIGGEPVRAVDGVSLRVEPGEMPMPYSNADIDATADGCERDRGDDAEEEQEGQADG